MADVYVVGSLNSDHRVRVNAIPKPGETVLGSEIVVSAGGKGANQSVAASRAGGVVIASIIAVGTTFGAGSLTDRVGRRRVYLAGCILAIAFGIPMYLLTNTGEPFLMVLVFIIGIGIIHATLTGTQGAWFAELFTTNTRTSGAYSFGATAALMAISGRSSAFVLRCGGRRPAV